MGEGICLTPGKLNKIYPKEVGKHPIRVNCREGELGERRASFSVNGGETDIEEEDSQFDFNQYCLLLALGAGMQGVGSAEEALMSVELQTDKERFGPVRRCI